MKLFNKLDYKSKGYISASNINIKCINSRDLKLIENFIINIFKDTNKKYDFNDFKNYFN